MVGMPPLPATFALLATPLATLATASNAASVDPIRAATIGAGTVAVILLVGSVVAIWLLRRRRRHRGASGVQGAEVGSNHGIGTDGATHAGHAGPHGITSTDDLIREAGASLVRADDAVEAAENEVGFAIAQFGVERASGFAEAVQDARDQVIEAFRIKQQLDDAHPESDHHRRDRTKRVIALSASAQAAIDEQASAFAALRRSEAESPARLAALREGITSTRGALPAASAAIVRLGTLYLPHTFSEVRANVDDASRALAMATERADDAANRITQTGVNTVSATTVSAIIDEGAALVHVARQSLAAIDEKTAALELADATLDSLIADARGDLAEARAIRDHAPDADSGALVLAAISGVKIALTDVKAPPTLGKDKRDPVAYVERLGHAVSALDTALAGARNQQQRLDHARAALVGALVGARSQIHETKRYLAGHRAGVEARTRLAEAERQLMLAESESDPVEALDAARRSTTAARDADALSKFDAL